MLSKNEVKYIQSLCHKKHRDELKLFVAEGPKLVDELLSSDFVLEHIYATTDWIKLRPSVSVPLTEVSEQELTRISNLTSANEVVAIARHKYHGAEPVLKKTITIVLDGIQDPGNMGTIVRIADWFGVKQIIASEDSVEVYNPKVIQATMGSICRVDVWYKDLAAWMSAVDVPVYGAMLNGENVYCLKNITEGLLVIGNEAKGIREDIRSRITHPVTIPGSGGAESLNAAVAAGIIIGSMVNGMRDGH
jgi:TrmH family RNA methyltransferase